MEIYTVADVEEAVDLAYRLKAERHYDWFRGQVHDWPPVSTYSRVQASDDSNRIKECSRRHELFQKWASTIPELQYLLAPEHIDDLMAIMQHYRIPTTYIDFTTDPGVAGFFAVDTKNPPAGGNACIYCLDTHDLMDVWNSIKDLNSRKEAKLALIEIDVRNLWRLRAQQGVFLFTNYNWTRDYPMDRILFPYVKDKYPSYPTREQIYPEHQSPLEQLLEQYFYVERAIRGDKILRESLNMTTMEIPGLPKGYDPEVFRSHLDPVSSWSDEVLRDWERPCEEGYQETVVGTRLQIKLPSHATVDQIRRSVSFGVKQALRSSGSTLRTKAVDWAFVGLPTSLPQDELSNVFRPIWNGMRRLPYTEEEIGEAFGTAMALLVPEFEQPTTTASLIERCSRCFGGECIQVAFGYADGSESRAVVAVESLRNALRPDLAELLVPSAKECINNFETLSVNINNPRLLFQFDEFKHMFAREVIPTQAVLRRKALLFNPAQVTSFGVP